MAQKYVVYLNGKALFFNNVAANTAIHIPGTTYPALLQAINTLNNSAEVCLDEMAPEHGIEMLRNHFPLIIAAGGVVESRKGNILLIFRMGTWDLPKGKVDEGETTDQAAAREIEEETGVFPGLPESLICRTWHSYIAGGREVLKETYWYHFRVTEEITPVVQTEEQITGADWYSIENAFSFKNNMYPAILDVLDAFRESH